MKKTLLKDWYSFIPVKLEIIKATKNREVQIIKKYRNSNITLRNLIIKTFKNLDYLLKSNDMYTKPANLYISCAIVEDLPFIAIPIKKAKSKEFWKLRKKKFENSFYKNVKGSDCVLDIDCTDWKKSLKPTIKIHEHFRQEHIRHNIKFSGSKGFHIKIPFLEVENHSELFRKIINKADYQKQLYDFKKFVTTMCKELDIPTIRTRKTEDKPAVDLSLFDKRHVYRIPYTIHPKTGFVALPLNQDMLYEFNKKMVNPETILYNKSVIIMEHGEPLL